MDKDEQTKDRIKLADDDPAAGRLRLLQVRRKTDGPWTEVPCGGSDPRDLGAAMVAGKAAQAFRVLEVVASGSR